MRAGTPGRSDGDQPSVLVTALTQGDSYAPCYMAGSGAGRNC
jgi:hypothetical protein